MRLALDHKRLDLNFLFCLFCFLAIPPLFPSLRLMFFAPFLIIALYQKPLKSCLWLAFWCGFLLDIFSSNGRLGLYALDFCLTVLILYPQRRHFFADSISTLPMITFCFSMLSTLMMALLLYSVESYNVFSWVWVVTDLFYISMMDALYAFCCFILPALVLNKPRRRGKDYFLNR